jgi:hypothetical protein
VLECLTSFRMDKVCFFEQASNIPIPSPLNYEYGVDSNEEEDLFETDRTVRTGAEEIDTRPVIQDCDVCSHRPRIDQDAYTIIQHRLRSTCRAGDDDSYTPASGTNGCCAVLVGTKAARCQSYAKILLGTICSYPPSHRSGRPHHNITPAAEYL